MSKNDSINPKHYKHPSGVECVDIAEHLPFCLGNALKYVWRAGEKGDYVEDLRKAEWYLKRFLKHPVVPPSRFVHEKMIKEDAAHYVRSETSEFKRGAVALIVAGRFDLEGLFDLKAVKRAAALVAEEIKKVEARS